MQLCAAGKYHVDRLAGLIGGYDGVPGRENPLVQEGSEPFELKNGYSPKWVILERASGSGGF
jgi:hypothetical protein